MIVFLSHIPPIYLYLHHSIDFEVSNKEVREFTPAESKKRCFEIPGTCMIMKTFVKQDQTLR